MPHPMEALQSEHVRMRRLLNLLDEQIAIFEQAGTPDYDLIKELLDYFLTYPDLCHHPRENLVLEKLRMRAPEAAEQVGALDHEHERLSRHLHDFSHAVMNLMLQVEVPRETLVKLAGDFIDDERRHMAEEERVFFPAARRHLTDEDWAEIGARVKRFSDPLDGPADGAQFGELRRALAQ